MYAHKALMAEDHAALLEGMREAERRANQADPAFQLAQYAGTEAQVSFELLVALLVCAHGEVTLSWLNPALDDPQMGTLMHLAAGTMLTAARLGHTSRCRAAALKLLKRLGALGARGAGGAGGAGGDASEGRQAVVRVRVRKGGTLTANGMLTRTHTRIHACLLAGFRHESPTRGWERITCLFTLLIGLVPALDLVLDLVLDLARDIKYH